MTRTARLVLATLLLPSPLLLAQDEVTTPGPQAGPGIANRDLPRFSLTPYGSHAFDADLRDGSSVAVTRAGLDSTARVPVSQNVGVNLGLLAEYSNYQFSAPFGFADLDLDMLQVQFAPGLDYRLSDEWSLFGGAVLQSSGQTSADAGDSLNYGAFLGARHKLSDKLSYTFGVAGMTQLEDDARISPVFGFEWNITQATSLTLGGGVNGGQLRLTQALSRTLGLSAVAGFEYRQYRLDDDGPLPDGVLQDSRVPLALELAWKPSDSFALRASAGYVVWSELEFNDNDGTELSNQHPDPTPFIGLIANWRF